MQMTKEALGLLIETSQAAKTPTEIEVGDVRKKYMLDNGEVVTVDVPPTPRQSEVCSLADVIALATSPVATNPTVWHSDTGVVLVLDDDDRHDRVVFRLTHPRAFSTLKGLDTEPKWLDQRSFVKLLRHELGLPQTTVAPFRRLNWSSQSTARADVEHTTDRLGRDIQAQVTGASELPEELLITISLYEQLGERTPATIRTAIDFDAGGERLTLAPLPGEMEQAIDAHQRHIQERLREELEDVRIYYGTP